MAVDLSQNFVSLQYLENKWTKFYQTFLLFILTRSTLGLLASIFRKFVSELWPLTDVRITLPLNASAQYLEKKLTNFYQTLYNYLY